MPTDVATNAADANATTKAGVYWSRYYFAIVGIGSIFFVIAGCNRLKSGISAKVCVTGLPKNLATMVVCTNLKLKNSV